MPEEPIVPSEIVTKLQALRRRRRLKHWPFLAILASMVVFLVLRVGFPSFSGSVFESVLVVAIGIGLIPAVLLSFVSVMHLRCPRCHDFFHSSKNPYYSEFAQSCVHCGLRLDGRNAATGSDTPQERTRGR
jgi:hypothetical protein